MKIHIAASEPHYTRHLESVWLHLPEGMRGKAFRTGITRDVKLLPEEDIFLVAGYGDIPPYHRTIFMEHGAGQTYQTEQRFANYYSGGKHPANVIAYLGPRQE